MDIEGCQERAAGAARVVDLDLPDPGLLAPGIEAALDVARFERVTGTGREQELVALAADADLQPFRGAAFGLQLPREPYGGERDRGQRQGFDAAVRLKLPLMGERVPADAAELPFQADFLVFLVDGVVIVDQAEAPLPLSFRGYGAQCLIFRGW